MRKASYIMSAVATKASVGAAETRTVTDKRHSTMSQEFVVRTFLKQNGGASVCPYTRINMFAPEDICLLRRLIHIVTIRNLKEGRM